LDGLISTWGAAGLVLVILIVGILLLRQRSRSRGETPMVALVRRRRELSAQLQALAGDSSNEILRYEARRLRAATNSVEVLEAAVERAERLSARAELRASEKSGK
jgi:hypothetical protein